MFAPEGTRFIVAAALIGAAVAIAGLLIGGWGWLLVALGALALGSTLWFFRDPIRIAPPGADQLLLAPADGTVTEIADEAVTPYLNGPGRRVTIALSPFDVHVSRSPATGRVDPSTAPDAPGGLALRHASGVPILARQTAGAGDREAGSDARIGRRIAAGERYGLVKLGSRVEVVVPPRVELDVEVGQRTVAGETVIGRMPTSDGGDGDHSIETDTLIEEAA